MSVRGLQRRDELHAVAADAAGLRDHRAVHDHERELAKGTAGLGTRPSDASILGRGQVLVLDATVLEDQARWLCASSHRKIDELDLAGFRHLCGHFAQEEACDATDGESSRHDESHDDLCVRLCGGSNP